MFWRNVSIFFIYFLRVIEYIKVCKVLQVHYKYCNAVPSVMHEFDRDRVKSSATHYPSSPTGTRWLLQSALACVQTSPQERHPYIRQTAAARNQLTLVIHPCIQNTAAPYPVVYLSPYDFEWEL